MALRRALRPRRAARCAPGSSGSSITARSTRCAARRCTRDRRSDDETAAERLEAPERVEEDVARRDEAAIVRNAMEILPADQLKVIELAYFGGFTHVEIAEMLESPVGTVKGRMRLGLKKMREVLAQGAVGHERGPDHERWEDAAGSYVLGALPDDERAGLRGASRRPARRAGPRSAELRVAAEALPRLAAADAARRPR